VRVTQNLIQPVTALTKALIGPIINGKYGCKIMNSNIILKVIKGLAFSTVLLWACNSFASLASASRLEKAGKYNQAIQAYLPLAKAGGAKAQLSLGSIYTNHVVNYKEAYHWNKLAANSSNPKAYANMGILYLRGWGVEKNLTKARSYFTYAAKHNVSMAQINLGFLYAKGQGGPQNLKQSFYWFMRAANQGSYYALFNLGSMYKDGLYVKKNYLKAIEYYQKSAAKGYFRAMNKLGFIYEMGAPGVPKNLAKAKLWFGKAAAKGNIEAKNALKILNQSHS
jgi:TPR repeat protein